MSTFRKIGLVVGGYAVALLVTYGVGFLRMKFETQDASGGMQGFGDMLLFIGVFGILSLIPTVLGLYYLRPWKQLWNTFSVAALALAATGPVAAILMGRHLTTPWIAFLVGFFGLIKVLGAPLFGVSFLIFAAFAPIPRSRWNLLLAAGVEFTVSAYMFFCMTFLRHWI